MPAFLKKSRNNVTTAELLINNGLPVTSAHPAYYSVFLLMKYLLARFGLISYSDQEVLTNGKDSHGVLSREALKLLAANDAITRNDYFVWYNKLKKMRKQADYTPQVLEEWELKDNLDTAKTFIKSADSHFKIQ